MEIMRNQIKYRKILFKSLVITSVKKATQIGIDSIETSRLNGKRKCQTLEEKLVSWISRQIVGRLSGRY